MNFITKVKNKIIDIIRLVFRNIFKSIVNDIRLNTYLVFGPKERLFIHPESHVQNALFNLSSGTIKVGKDVSFGHNVTVLTGHHDLSKTGNDRVKAVKDGGNDIIIRNGAWVSSNCTLIGPCEIGENAVVAAGSVVVNNVKPFTLVAGVPSVFVRNL